MFNTDLIEDSISTFIYKMRRKNTLSIPKLLIHFWIDTLIKKTNIDRVNLSF